MAKKGSDQAHLEELRNEIRTLQSEYAKKKEDFERKQRQRKEAQAELNRGEESLQIIINDLASLVHTSKRPSAEGSQDIADVATHDYMYAQVGNLLKQRIPIMAAIQEDPTEHDDVGRSDNKDRQPEDQAKAAVHDTVLVSYVVIGADDYQVAYRIDSETTVRQLHRDACSYWGCSHNDFVLCKITSSDQAMPLWGRDSEKELLDSPLQSEDVLSPAEKAQLHLVKVDDLENFKKQRQQVKEQEMKQDAQARDKTSDANTIKTLKHGFGYATQEVVTEPFIEALRPWPGIHHLMKTESKSRDHQRWIRTKLSDVVLFAVLIILSSCVFAFRTSPNGFLLRTGVADFLANAYGLEWTGQDIVKFDGIRQYDDIWAWLGGPFRQQLYNDTSTLNQFYKPVGYLRLRQQKAKSKDCPLRDIPSNLAQTCHYVYVTAELQDTSTYYPSLEDELFTNASGKGGRESTPDPFTWQPSASPFFNTHGLIHHSYDGSGYMIVYNLSASTGTQFLEDLSFISTSWITPQTRMFAAELTLANYNLGGYVSATFLFEISPSGAISPSMDLTAFTLYNWWSKDLADVFDVVRWLLVVGYIGIVRFILRSRQKMGAGKSRFAYLLSGSGMLCLIIVGLFCGIQYMQLSDAPSYPETLQEFYSYAWYAHDMELISILEACLILALLLALVSLARMAPTVYRFFKLFHRAAVMCAYFLICFMPVLLGACFLANTIWSPYIFSLNTWMSTYLTCLLGVYQPFPEVVAMQEKGGMWTLPFLLLFALAISAFMIHIVLAIMVHSYFEVELVEGSVPQHDEWSRDQWLDWALWAPVYSKLTGKKAGASRIVGYAEADDDEGSDSDSDSDEEK
mmetsp:Transcript_37347/g.93828  ORF Transcript_37347/g.93828 Transcript_37347/m.93828 type:complete len:853 (-) Transcript_37347:44-2602(-)